MQYPCQLLSASYLQQGLALASGKVIASLHLSVEHVEVEVWLHLLLPSCHARRSHVGEQALLRWHRIFADFPLDLVQVVQEDIRVIRRHFADNRTDLLLTSTIQVLDGLEHHIAERVRVVHLILASPLYNISFFSTRVCIYHALCVGHLYLRNLLTSEIFLPVSCIYYANQVFLTIYIYGTSLASCKIYANDSRASYLRRGQPLIARPAADQPQRLLRSAFWRNPPTPPGSSGTAGATENRPTPPHRPRQRRSSGSSSASLRLPPDQQTRCLLPTFNIRYFSTSSCIYYAIHTHTHTHIYIHSLTHARR